MARTSAARKPRADRAENAVKPQVRGRPFAKGNPGRRKGSKNKVTKEMLLSAREAFAPMAELTIERGNKHLNDCEKDECGTCRHYEGLAVAYTYGKPVQSLDIDSSALRTQIEELARLSGQTPEEVEADAERLGIPLIGNGRRIA